MSQDFRHGTLPPPSEFKYLEGSFDIPKTVNIHFQDDSYNSLLPVAPSSFKNSEKEAANLHFVQQDLRKPRCIQNNMFPLGSRFCHPHKEPAFSLFMQLDKSSILMKGQSSMFAINDFPVLKRRGLHARCQSLQSTDYGDDF